MHKINYHQLHASCVRGRMPLPPPLLTHVPIYLHTPSFCWCRNEIIFPHRYNIYYNYIHCLLHWSGSLSFSIYRSPHIKTFPGKHTPDPSRCLCFIKKIVLHQKSSSTPPTPTPNEIFSRRNSVPSYIIIIFVLYTLSYNCRLSLHDCHYWLDIFVISHSSHSHIHHLHSHQPLHYSSASSQLHTLRLTHLSVAMGTQWIRVTMSWDITLTCYWSCDLMWHSLTSKMVIFS